jgi:drug/metabolite transporter (DMT)-like permease
MTRSMSATETAESLILYSALAPMILLTPTLWFTQWPSVGLLQWGLLLLLGLFGGLGHWCLIQAYRRATATALAPYPYMQMVWVIAAGWLVFGQFPDVWTLAGAGIIMASGLYIVHREHRLRVLNRAVADADVAEVAKKL